MRMRDDNVACCRELGHVAFVIPEACYYKGTSQVCVELGHIFFLTFMWRYYTSSFPIYIVPADRWDTGLKKNAVSRSYSEYLSHCVY